MMQEAAQTEALLDARYRLSEVVGTGGMATVYRAEDIALERSVAVKVFRSSDDVATTADRAHSEKALLASLNHPNLVTLLDARLDPGRTQYLVMEFVPGPTLSTQMARAALTPREVARIGADVAGALHAVHRAGIVHRDVKPSNVLLLPPSDTNPDWTAKLADFGIACAIDASRMTSPGIVLGTLTYMAPEQLRNQDIRPAIDVYALALVLLEALTGQPGYSVSPSIESTLARLHLPPHIPTSLGRGWVRLLTAMTSVEPDERPHAAAVEAELRRLAQVSAVAPADERDDPTLPLVIDSGPPPTSQPAASHTPLRRNRLRPAGRTRRRESLLVAAVVAIGAVTTVGAALLGHTPQAAASGGAVVETLRVAEPDVEAPTTVQDTVAPQPLPSEESRAGSPAGGPEEAVPAAQTDRAAGNGPGSSQGKGPASDAEKGTRGGRGGKD